MVDALTARIARVRRIAQAMAPDTKAIDEALPSVRALFAAAAVPYRIVGGLAVVHHGYARTTEDIDLLVGRDALARIEPLLASHGFEHAIHPNQLRHAASGVRIDLLIEGHTIARPGAAPFPDPQGTASSESDPTVVALPVLIELKLQAKRHQDIADIVALLKRLDDAHYIEVEAAVAAHHRAELARLRDDALEELEFERTQAQ
jgi:hypothetical protein